MSNSTPIFIILCGMIIGLAFSKVARRKNDAPKSTPVTLSDAPKATPVTLNGVSYLTKNMSTYNKSDSLKLASLIKSDGLIVKEITTDDLRKTLGMSKSIGHTYSLLIPVSKINSYSLLEREFQEKANKEADERIEIKNWFDHPILAPILYLIILLFGICAICLYFSIKRYQY